MYGNSVRASHANFKRRRRKFPVNFQPNRPRSIKFRLPKLFCSCFRKNKVSKSFKRSEHFDQRFADLKNTDISPLLRDITASFFEKEFSKYSKNNDGIKPDVQSSERCMSTATFLSTHFFHLSKPIQYDTYPVSVNYSSQMGKMRRYAQNGQQFKQTIKRDVLESSALVNTATQTDCQRKTNSVIDKVTQYVDSMSVPRVLCNKETNTSNVSKKSTTVLYAKQSNMFESTDDTSALRTNDEIYRNTDKKKKSVRLKTETKEQRNCYTSTSDTCIYAEIHSKFREWLEFMQKSKKKKTVVLSDSTYSATQTKEYPTSSSIVESLTHQTPSSKPDKIKTLIEMETQTSSNFDPGPKKLTKKLSPLCKLKIKPSKAKKSEKKKSDRHCNAKERKEALSKVAEFLASEEPVLTEEVQRSLNKLAGYRQDINHQRYPTFIGMDIKKKPTEICIKKKKVPRIIIGKKKDVGTVKEADTPSVPHLGDIKKVDAEIDMITSKMQEYLDILLTDLDNQKSSSEIAVIGGDTAEGSQRSSASCIEQGDLELQPLDKTAVMNMCGSSPPVTIVPLLHQFQMKDCQEFTKDLPKSSKHIEMGADVKLVEKPLEDKKEFRFANIFKKKATHDEIRPTNLSAVPGLLCEPSPAIDLNDDWIEQVLSESKVIKPLETQEKDVMVGMPFKAFDFAVDEGNMAGVSILNSEDFADCSTMVGQSIYLTNDKSTNTKGECSNSAAIQASSNMRNKKLAASNKKHMFHIGIQTVALCPSDISFDQLTGNEKILYARDRKVIEQLEEQRKRKVKTYFHKAKSVMIGLLNKGKYEHSYTNTEAIDDDDDCMNSEEDISIASRDRMRVKFSNIVIEGDAKDSKTKVISLPESSSDLDIAEGRKQNYRETTVLSVFSSFYNNKTDRFSSEEKDRQLKNNKLYGLSLLGGGDNFQKIGLSTCKFDYNHLKPIPIATYPVMTKQDRSRNDFIKSSDYDVFPSSKKRRRGVACSKIRKNKNPVTGKKCGGGGCRDDTNDKKRKKFTKKAKKHPTETNPFDSSESSWSKSELRRKTLERIKKLSSCRKMPDEFYESPEIFKVRKDNKLEVDESFIKKKLIEMRRLGKSTSPCNRQKNCGKSAEKQDAPQDEPKSNEPGTVPVKRKVTIEDVTTDEDTALAEQPDSLAHLQKVIKNRLVKLMKMVDDFEEHGESKTAITDISNEELKVVTELGEFSRKESKTDVGDSKKLATAVLEAMKEGVHEITAVAIDEPHRNLTDDELIRLKENVLSPPEKPTSTCKRCAQGLPCVCPALTKEEEDAIAKQEEVKTMKPEEDKNPRDKSERERQIKSDREEEQRRMSLEMADKMRERLREQEREKEGKEMQILNEESVFGGLPKHLSLEALLELPPDLQMKLFHLSKQQQEEKQRAIRNQEARQRLKPKTRKPDEPLQKPVFKFKPADAGGLPRGVPADLAFRESQEELPQEKFLRRKEEDRKRKEEERRQLEEERKKKEEEERRKEEEERKQQEDEQKRKEEEERKQQEEQQKKEEQRRKEEEQRKRKEDEKKMRIERKEAAKKAKEDEKRFKEEAKAWEKRKREEEAKKKKWGSPCCKPKSDEAEKLDLICICKDSNASEQMKEWISEMLGGKEFDDEPEKTVIDKLDEMKRDEEREKLQMPEKENSIFKTISIQSSKGSHDEKISSRMQPSEPDEERRKAKRPTSATRTKYKRKSTKIAIRKKIPCKPCMSAWEKPMDDEPVDALPAVPKKNVKPSAPPPPESPEQKKSELQEIAGNSIEESKISKVFLLQQETPVEQKKRKSEKSTSVISVPFDYLEDESPEKATEEKTDEEFEPQLEPDDEFGELPPEILAEINEERAIFADAGPLDSDSDMIDDWRVIRAPKRNWWRGPFDDFFKELIPEISKKKLATDATKKKKKGKQDEEKVEEKTKGELSRTVEFSSDEPQERSKSVATSTTDLEESGKDDQLEENESKEQPLTTEGHSEQKIQGEEELLKSEGFETPKEFGPAPKPPRVKLWDRLWTKVMNLVLKAKDKFTDLTKKKRKEKKPEAQPESRSLYSEGSVSAGDDTKSAISEVPPDSKSEKSVTTQGTADLEEEVKKEPRDWNKWLYFWKPSDNDLSEAADPLDRLDGEKRYPVSKKKFEPVFMPSQIVGRTKVIIKPLPRMTRAFPRIKEVSKAPDEIVFRASTLLEYTAQREQLDIMNLRQTYGVSPSTRKILSLQFQTEHHYPYPKPLEQSRTEGSLIMLHKAASPFPSTDISVSDRYMSSSGTSSDDYLLRPPPEPKIKSKPDSSELELIHVKSIYLKAGLRMHYSDKALMNLLTTYTWKRLRRPSVPEVVPVLADLDDIDEEDDLGISSSIFFEKPEPKTAEAAVEQAVKEEEEPEQTGLDRLMFLRNVLRGDDPNKFNRVDKPVDDVDLAHYDIIFDEYGNPVIDTTEQEARVVSEPLPPEDEEETVIKIINPSPEPEVLTKPEDMKNPFEFASSGVGKPVIEVSNELQSYMETLGVFVPPVFVSKPEKDWADAIMKATESKPGTVDLTGFPLDKATETESTDESPVGDQESTPEEKHVVLDMKNLDATALQTGQAKMIIRRSDPAEDGDIDNVHVTICGDNFIITIPEKYMRDQQMTTCGTCCSCEEITMGESTTIIQTKSSFVESESEMSLTFQKETEGLIDTAPSGTTEDTAKDDSVKGKAKSTPVVKPTDSHDGTPLGDDLDSSDLATKGAAKVRSTPEMSSTPTSDIGKEAPSRGDWAKAEQAEPSPTSDEEAPPQAKANSTPEMGSESGDVFERGPSMISPYAVTETPSKKKVRPVTETSKSPATSDRLERVPKRIAPDKPDTTKGTPAPRKEREDEVASITSAAEEIPSKGKVKSLPEVQSEKENGPLGFFRALKRIGTNVNLKAQPKLGALRFKKNSANVALDPPEALFHEDCSSTCPKKIRWERNMKDWKRDLNKAKPAFGENCGPECANRLKWEAILKAREKAMGGPNEDEEAPMKKSTDQEPQQEEITQEEQPNPTSDGPDKKRSHACMSPSCSAMRKISNKIEAAASQHGLRSHSKLLLNIRTSSTTAFPGSTTASPFEDESSFPDDTKPSVTDSPEPKTTTETVPATPSTTTEPLEETPKPAHKIEGSKLIIKIQDKKDKQRRPRETPSKPYATLAPPNSSTPTPPPDRSSTRHIPLPSPSSAEAVHRTSSETPALGDSKQIQLSAMTAPPPSVEALAQGRPETSTSTSSSPKDSDRLDRLDGVARKSSSRLTGLKSPKIYRRDRSPKRDDRYRERPEAPYRFDRSLDKISLERKNSFLLDKGPDESEGNRGRPDLQRAKLMRKSKRSSSITSKSSLEGIPESSSSKERNEGLCSDTCESKMHQIKKTKGQYEMTSASVAGVCGDRSKYKKKDSSTEKSSPRATTETSSNITGSTPEDIPDRTPIDPRGIIKKTNKDNAPSYSSIHKSANVRRVETPIPPSRRGSPSEIPYAASEFRSQSGGKPHFWRGRYEPKQHLKDSEFAKKILELVHPDRPRARSPPSPPPPLSHFNDKKSEKKQNYARDVKEKYLPPLLGLAKGMRWKGKDSAGREKKAKEAEKEPERRPLEKTISSGSIVCHCDVRPSKSLTKVKDEPRTNVKPRSQNTSSLKPKEPSKIPVSLTGDATDDVNKIKVLVRKSGEHKRRHAPDKPDKGNQGAHRKIQPESSEVKLKRTASSAVSGGGSARNDRKLLAQDIAKDFGERSEIYRRKKAPPPPKKDPLIVAYLPDVFAPFERREDLVLRMIMPNRRVYSVHYCTAETSMIPARFDQAAWVHSLSVGKTEFSSGFAVNQTHTCLTDEVLNGAERADEEAKEKKRKLRDTAEVEELEMPSPLEELGLFPANGLPNEQELPNEKRVKGRSQALTRKKKNGDATRLSSFVYRSQVDPTNPDGHVNKEGEIAKLEDVSDKESHHPSGSNLKDLYLIKSDTIIRKASDVQINVNNSKSTNIICPPIPPKPNLTGKVLRECNDIFQKVKRFHQPMVDPIMKSNVLCPSKKKALHQAYFEEKAKQGKAKTNEKHKKKAEKKAKVKAKKSKDSMKEKDPAAVESEKESKDHGDVIVRKVEVPAVEVKSKESVKTDKSKDSVKGNKCSKCFAPKKKKKGKNDSTSTSASETSASEPTGSSSASTASTKTIESTGSSLNCDGECQTEGLCYCKMTNDKNKSKHSRKVRTRGKSKRDFANTYQARIKPYTCCVHAKDEGRSYCKKVTFDPSKSKLTDLDPNWVPPHLQTAKFKSKENLSSSVCTDSSVTSIETVKKMINKKQKKAKKGKKHPFGLRNVIPCPKSEDEPNSKMSGYNSKEKRTSPCRRKKRKRSKTSDDSSTDSTTSKDTSQSHSNKIPFFQRLFKKKAKPCNLHKTKKRSSKKKGQTGTEVSDDEFPVCKCSKPQGSVPVPAPTPAPAPAPLPVLEGHHPPETPSTRPPEKHHGKKERGRKRSKSPQKNQHRPESPSKSPEEKKKKLCGSPCTGKKTTPGAPESPTPPPMPPPILRSIESTRCACNIKEQKAKGKRVPGIKRFGHPHGQYATAPAPTAGTGASPGLTSKSSQPSILKKQQPDPNGSLNSEKKLSFETPPVSGSQKSSTNTNQTVDSNKNNAHVSVHSTSSKTLSPYAINPEPSAPPPPQPSPTPGKKKKDQPKKSKESDSKKKKSKGKKEVPQKPINGDFPISKDFVVDTRNQTSKQSSDTNMHNVSIQNVNQSHSTPTKRVTVKSPESKDSAPLTFKERKALERDQRVKTNNTQEDSCFCDIKKNLRDARSSPWSMNQQQTAIKCPLDAKPVGKRKSCCPMMGKSKEPAKKSPTKVKGRPSSETELSPKGTPKSRVISRHPPEKCHEKKDAKKKAKKTKKAAPSPPSKAGCFCDSEDDPPSTPSPSAIRHSKWKSCCMVSPRRGRPAGSSGLSSEELVQKHDYDVRRVEMPANVIDIYKKQNMVTPKKDEIFDTLISMLFKERKKNKCENTRRRMVKNYLSQVSSSELEEIVLELVSKLPNGLEDIMNKTSSPCSVQISKALSSLILGKKKSSHHDNQIKYNTSKSYLKKFKNRQFLLDQSLLFSKCTTKQIAITCSEDHDCSCIARPSSTEVSDVTDEDISPLSSKPFSVYKRKTDYAIDIDKVEVFCRKIPSDHSWCSVTASDSDKTKAENSSRKGMQLPLNTEDAQEIMEIIRLLSKLSPRDLCRFFSRQCMK